MLVILLAYIGGILTILSPCILPVLPFVFARGDRPFLTNGLPLLGGMALTFAGVASLAAVGGGWAVAANSYGRWVALALMTGFALLLIFPNLATRAMRPLVGLGERLATRADRSAGIGSSALLGVATGLLWAPCAGPILGLILTGAALSGATATTVLLLLAYALGAATSLGLAVIIGGKIFAAMKRSIGAGEGIRKALGVLILIGAFAIALGLDTRVLATLSTTQTVTLESGLAQRLGLEKKMPRTTTAALADEGPLPTLDGATGWLGARPATAGKVVLVDFWTYSCINCIRAIPHVRALHDRYVRHGLVIVGVHSPEFAFERDPANVARAIREQRIAYPVALDNKLAVWRAFDNRYWPAQYLADAKGRIRYHHFGEGGEATTEAAIRKLLTENGARLGAMAGEAETKGAAAAADFARVRSRETYLGTARAANFASPGGLRPGEADYRLPPQLSLNQWGFAGRWQAEPKQSRLLTPSGKIAFRFEARDLHLVFGSASGRPIRFRVTIDGKPPGADHGVDIDSAGNGTVSDHRLYQLVRQKAAVTPRNFEVIFLDRGVEAYAFTFG
jgi:cytochrome c biogenesis protein CcdA/thiol-disulfide isomerase/thioredoxin